MCIWILDNLMHVRILNEHFVLLDVTWLNKLLLLLLLLDLIPWYPTFPRASFTTIVPGDPLFPWHPLFPFFSFGLSFPCDTLSVVCPLTPSLPYGLWGPRNTRHSRHAIGSWKPRKSTGRNGFLRRKQPGLRKQSVKLELTRQNPANLRLEAVAQSGFEPLNLANGSFVNSDVQFWCHRLEALIRRIG